MNVLVFTPKGVGEDKPSFILELYQENNKNYLGSEKTILCGTNKFSDEVGVMHMEIFLGEKGKCFGHDFYRLSESYKILNNFFQNDPKCVARLSARSAHF